MGQSRPLFVYFRHFLVTISIQIEKSIDGVLGIRTRGRRMVGADETTELWRPRPRVALTFPAKLRSRFFLWKYSVWNAIGYLFAKTRHDRLLAFPRYMCVLKTLSHLSIFGRKHTVVGIKTLSFPLRYRYLNGNRHLTNFVLHTLCKRVLKM